jgi:hypothetical protein
MSEGRKSALREKVNVANLVAIPPGKKTGAFLCLGTPEYVATFFYLSLAKSSSLQEPS